MARMDSYVEFFIGGERHTEGDKINYFVNLQKKERAHDVALYYLSLLLDSPEMFPVIIDYMVRTETHKLPEKYWFNKTDEEKKYFKVRVVKRKKGTVKTLFEIELDVEGFTNLETIRETNNNNTKIIGCKTDTKIVPRKIQQYDGRLYSLLSSKEKYSDNITWSIDSNKEYWLELFKIDDKKSIYLKQDPNNNYHFRYIIASEVDIVERNVTFTKNGRISAQQVYDQFMRGKLDLFNFYVKTKKRKLYIGDNVLKNNEKFVVLGFDYNMTSNTICIKHVKNLDGKPSIEFVMDIIPFFKNYMIPHDNKLEFENIINEVESKYIDLCKINSVDELYSTKQKYENEIAVLLDKAKKLNISIENDKIIDSYRLLLFKKN